MESSSKEPAHYLEVTAVFRVDGSGSSCQEGASCQEDTKSSLAKRESNSEGSARRPGEHRSARRTLSSQTSCSQEGAEKAKGL